MKPEQLSTKELNEAMKDEFLKLDANGDGEVSIEEVEKVLQSMRCFLKATQGDIRWALKSMDLDGDGIISMKEYLNNDENRKSRELMYRALVLRSRLRKEFAIFDADKNGFISKEELLHVIKERGVISPDQVDKFIKETDTDGNGEIDFEEFVAIMTK